MRSFDYLDLKNLYIPPSNAHKGASGKLTIIGGSRLFHGASLWALKIASRIVDMVFYSSVEENNELTQKLKGEVYDFIAVGRENVEEYIEQSDVVLIGPGLAREDGRSKEEEPTRELTKRLLEKFPSKKWVIDAGSLQTIDPEWLKRLNRNVIITPHQQEFEQLFNPVIASPSETRAKQSLSEGIATDSSSPRNDIVLEKAKEYNCVILLKGQVDIVCSPQDCVQVPGGNAGMTKGGTGDVLAGLVAALACKNDLFLAAKAGSYLNKKAGDSLFRKVGPYFNASDLCDEIPKVMKEIIST